MNRPTAAKPPILIEFQSTVNHYFMGRVIRYALSCKNRYNVYPIVLILVINGFSSVDVEKEFINDGGSLSKH